MLSSRAMPTGVQPVVRPRLLHQLDHAAHLPLTLVVAPAGYGKSTLVDQWAARGTGATAWVDLSDAVTTSSMLCAAIVRAVAAGRPEPTPHVALSLDALIAWLQTISETQIPLTLIFDDYHLIQHPNVHLAMSGLLARLPPHTRIILVSRARPPLALSRMCIEGRVAELADQDLRFTGDEVAAAVRQFADGRLTSEQIQHLATQTSGWIAGIRLILASLQRDEPTATQSVMDSWTAQRLLDDYIGEEVLNSFPDDVRDFALKSVLLDRLDPELCNFVLDIESGASLIHSICHHLPCARPHEINDVPRYHRLFVESVQRIAAVALSQSTIQTIHRRAAQWLESHGEFEGAIDHAVLIEDWETALRCVRSAGCTAKTGDPHHVRLDILQKIPESILFTDPHLMWWYISDLLYTGHVSHALDLFTRIEAMWQDSNDPTQLGYAASCRARFSQSRGHLDVALRHIHDALHHFPLTYHLERVYLWSAIHDIERDKGSEELAELAFHQALAAQEQTPAFRTWWDQRIEREQANRQALRGNLRTAEHMYRDYLARVPANHRSQEGAMRMGLAAIYLEQNKVDLALGEIEQITIDLAISPHHGWHAEALLIAAQVYMAAGREDDYAAALQHVRSIYQQYGDPSVMRRLEIMEALAWIRTGQLDRARLFAWHHDPDSSWVRTYGIPDSHLALVQLHVASGDFGQAAAQVDATIAQAQSAGRWADLVPLLVWQAVALQALGDEAGATGALKVAVICGARGGFVRSFLTPGSVLAPVFTRLRPQLTVSEAAYLDFISGHSCAAASDLAVPDTRQISPPRGVFSERERQVFTLLEQGLTNRHIAERLFISHRTVQKHVISILRKTGMPNRVAAVGFARNEDGTTAT